MLGKETFFSFILSFIFKCFPHDQELMVSSDYKFRRYILSEIKYKAVEVFIEYVKE